MKKKHIEDFEMEVDPRPLTKEEEKAISDFIKADKLKRAKAEERKAKRRAASKEKTK